MLVCRSHAVAVLGPAHPHSEGFRRDFGVVSDGPNLVAQIAAIFASDFQGPSGNETNSPASSHGMAWWSNGSTGLPNYYPNGGSYRTGRARRPARG